MGKLDGKVALVTGSGRNIGRATVLKLAGEGCDVVVNARSNQAEADEVVREAKKLGVKAISVLADVGRREAVEAMAQRALGEFGRVDILINNAAIRPHKPFTELTVEDWEEVRGIVLDGALYLTRAIIPSMVANNYGRILFFCGDGAFSGSGAGRAHISAAKMGLIGMCRALASEFAPKTSGSTSSRPAASTPGATTRSGITDGRRAPPAFRWGARAPSTRSPRPACSWWATMAALSPARRST